MTVPLWSLVFVAALPYVLAISSTGVKISAFGKLDNNHPRKQAENLEGFGHRLVAAQMNGWETLPSLRSLWWFAI